MFAISFSGDVVASIHHGRRQDDDDDDVGVTGQGQDPENSCFTFDDDDGPIGCKEPVDL